MHAPTPGASVATVSSPLGIEVVRVLPVVGDLSHLVVDALLGVVVGVALVVVYLWALGRIGDSGAVLGPRRADD